MDAIDVPRALDLVLERTVDSVRRSENDDGVGSCGWVETLDRNVDDVVGRVLAKDVVAPAPGFPPFRASVMDGYAARYDDLVPRTGGGGGGGGGATELRVVGASFAGEAVRRYDDDDDDDDDPLPRAWYVATGAVVPPDADTVVPVEGAESSSRSGRRVRLADSTATTARRGQWIRPVGCDVAAGETVLTKGTVLEPAHVGLLTQIGARTVTVRRRARVGVLSTGNELLRDDDDDGDDRSTSEGAIPDANRPVLLSLLRRATFADRVETIDLGIAPDDPESLKAALTDALREHRCDVVVTSGGASAGEKDHLWRVLTKDLADVARATAHFARLNMRPGRPTKFVSLEDATTRRTTLVLALPGNPVSALVCSHLLLCPMLDALSVGTADAYEARVHDEVLVTLAHDFRLDGERPEYHRVTLRRSRNETTGREVLTATSTGVQRSSRLASMTRADGLLCLPRGAPERPVATRGTADCLVLLFSWSYGSGRFGGSTIARNQSRHLSSSSSWSSLSSPLFGNETRARGVGLVVVTDGGDDDDDDRYARNVRSRAEALFAEDGRDDFVLARPTATTVRGDAAVDVASARALASKLSDLLRDEHVAATTDLLLVVTRVSEHRRGVVGRSTLVAAALAESSTVSRPADAVAALARRGAARRRPSAALFEPAVAHHRPSDGDGGGALIVSLPDVGLEEAWREIRHLLPRAVDLGKGRTTTRPN